MLNSFYSSSSIANADFFYSKMSFVYIQFFFAIVFVAAFVCTLRHQWSSVTSVSNINMDAQFIKSNIWPRQYTRL